MGHRLLLPLAFGRLVGYPKFRADRMPLARGNDRWRGEVRHRGRLALSVQFDPGEGDLTPADRELLARLGGPAGERPYFLQLPAGRGPWLNRLTYTETVGCRMDARDGRGTARVDVDESWAALFPDGVLAGVGKRLQTHGTGFGWLTSRRVWNGSPIAARDRR